MLVNREIEDERWVHSFFRGCFAAINCHTVHEGRYYRCSRAHTLENRMRLHGREVWNKTLDGIDLHGTPDLGTMLAAYIATDEPLVACKFCLGNHGKAFPHEQLSKIGIRQEMSETHDDLRSLLKPDAVLDPDEVPRRKELELRWWDVTKAVPAQLQTSHRTILNMPGASGDGRA
jgi:hypothetical protein